MEKTVEASKNYEKQWGIRVLMRNTSKPSRAKVVISLELYIGELKVMIIVLFFSESLQNMSAGSFAKENDAGNGKSLGEELKEDITKIKGTVHVVLRQLDELSAKARRCKGMWRKKFNEFKTQLTRD